MLRTCTVTDRCVFLDGTGADVATYLKLMYNLQLLGSRSERRDGEPGQNLNVRLLKILAPNESREQINCIIDGHHRQCSYHVSRSLGRTGLTKYSWEHVLSRATFTPLPTSLKGLPAYLNLRGAAGCSRVRRMGFTPHKPAIDGHIFSSNLATSLPSHLLPAVLLQSGLQHVATSFPLAWRPFYPALDLVRVPSQPGGQCSLPT